MRKDNLRSQIELTEREQAKLGPRTLKTPGSPPWCFQTLDRLANYYKNVERDYQQVLEVIAELAQFKAWKVVPPNRPYGTLSNMLKAEIGIDQKELSRKIKTAARIATQAEDQADRGSQRAIGTNQYSEGVDNIEKVSTPSRPTGTSRDQALRRLRKDRPDLHARVLAGDITPHAGMVVAGFRKRRVPKPKPKQKCPHCGHEW